MRNPVLDKTHLLEYFVNGLLAAILFTIPVWFFLASANYQQSWLVYIGCGLFMLAIMRYAMVLTRRKLEQGSTVMMLMEGHLAILFGIVMSVVFCVILCLFYLPGFMSDNDQSQLANAPAGMNPNHSGTLLQIFVPATVGNFGISALISIVVSYVIKRNQTSDRPAPL